jgi:DNA-binding NarL/FixJ family response regulator
MNQLSVLIVDDHPVVREGLKGLLQSIAWITSIEAAAHADEALDALEKKYFDLVITDIHMPGKSGIDLALIIQKNFRPTKVLAMSTFGDRTYVSEMIKNGASGFISKNSDKETIEDAILRIMNDEVVIGKHLEETARPAIIHEDQPVLTRREREVLNLIAQGLTNKEIADKIFVSTTTVDSHRKNLLHKFQVMNTASLVAQAAKFQLLD